MDSEWEELTLWRDTKQLNVLGTLKVRVKRKKDWKGERRLIRVDDKYREEKRKKKPEFLLLPQEEKRFTLSHYFHFSSMNEVT